MTHRGAPLGSQILDTPLSRIDGRVVRLAEVLTAGTTLAVFVERDCPTSRGALRVLSTVSMRTVVVSQGHLAAAVDLMASTGVEDVQILIEPSPHAISAALGIRTVPTFVLLSPDGAELRRCEGWDRRQVEQLVVEAGGELGDGSSLPITKPGCQSRSTLDAETQKDLEAADAALRIVTSDQIEDMWDLGWHDGLPVVPPTPTRVERMLDGRDPGHSLGRMPPALGEVTLARLASCAVLAGCEPSYFPVVCAAAEAVLDQRFNVHGIQNTTHFASPVLIVNGPVRHQIGMNCGSNVLGPGNRANATIGRAVRLLMLLTGGGTPGGLDQSTLGGPHKWSFCFAENEEASPWEPLNVTRGFAWGSSTVTAIAGEGPRGINDHQSRTPEELATSFALALETTLSPTLFPMDAQTLVIVSPEHAITLASEGWSRSDFADWLRTRARRSAGELLQSGSRELSEHVRHAVSEEELVPKFLRAEDIIIVVAGGLAGRFSAIVGPWATGSATELITKEITA